DTVVITFPIQVADNEGGVATATVTVTITGTNDVPVIDTAQPVTTSLVEAIDADPLSNTPPQLQTLIATGALAVTDVDVADVLTGTVTAAAAVVWTPNGGVAVDASADPRFASLIAQSALSFNATAVSNGAQQTLNYTYTVTDADINFLGAGDTVVITFPVQIADDAGGIDTTTVTVTITGTNDFPVLEASTGGITETANTTLSLAANTVSSSMAFTDVDLSDVGHTATILGVTRGGESDGLPSGFLGTLYLRSLLSINSVTKAAGSADGQVNWTFSAPDALFDYLSHGQTTTLTYTVRVSDGDGGTSTNTVTVTILGTNDQPVFVAGAVRVGLENVDQTGSAALETFSGTLLFVDPDRDDAAHTASVTGLSATGTTAGLNQAALASALSITGVSTAINQVGGSVSWSFAAADSQFD
ncbi:MAG: VCBS domain-containing protein, partial [Hoeflea sp.]|nr:VCBS domain-containing protein [Hoeflea sp.]